MTKKKEEDDIPGQVAINTKANSIMIKDMEKVRWFGQMEAATKATGQMEFNMELVCYETQRKRKPVILNKMCLSMQFNVILTNCQTVHFL